MSEPGRPSRIWYVIATVLLIGSASVAFVSMYLSINSMKLTSVRLPGTLDVVVEEQGEWVVCIESHDGSEPADVSMELRFTDGFGDVRSVEPRVGSFRYRMGSVRAFEVGSATLSSGAWTLAGTLPDADAGDQQWSYSVGPSPVEGMAVIMLVGGAIAVVLLSLGLGMLMLVFWYRLKNRPSV